jgi:soluble lytic murein transglycosylase-like protein
MKLIPLLLLLLSTSALAGEYALLASGMRLRVDRHEQRGPSIVLYSGEGSTTLGAAEVTGFEAEEYVAPKAAAPVVAAAPAATAPAPAAAVDPKALVEAAAQKTAIPAKLLRSVVAAESAFQPQVVSPKGAIGLMQLMPATASQYGADPKDPAQNVEAGTAYLRDLLIKYKGDVALALAAYNAGPGAVQKYGGVPPYAETRSYVGRVIRNWQNTPTPK